MKVRDIALFSVSIPFSLAGCKSRELPAELTGSYYRAELAVGDLEITRARLYLTKSGVAVTAPKLSQSVTLLGQPMINQEVSTLRNGAALFDSVKCDDQACSFATKDGCSGTITRAADSIVVIATGPCSSWSGKWLRGDPPSAKPLGVSPPSLPTPTFPGDDDAFEKSVKCRIACGNDHQTCAFACNMGDIACHQGCNKSMAACQAICPKG